MLIAVHEYYIVELQQTNRNQQVTAVIIPVVPFLQCQNNKADNAASKSPTQHVVKIQINSKIYKSRV